MLPSEQVNLNLRTPVMSLLVIMPLSAAVVNCCALTGRVPPRSMQPFE